MTNNSGNHILVKSDGTGITAYDCTLENLQMLVEEAAAGYCGIGRTSELHQRMTAGGPALMPVSGLADALRELHDSKPGADLPKLRELLYGPAEEGRDAASRPAVVATRAWQQELVLWAFDNREHIPGVFEGFDRTVNGMTAACPFERLSFLAGVSQRFPQGVVLVDAQYLAAAQDLYTMRNRRWSADADPLMVARLLYLPFIQTWMGGTWDLVKIQRQVGTSVAPAEPDMECAA